jgi:hypothetical protein
VDERALELLERIFVWGRKGVARITAEEACKHPFFAQAFAPAKAGLADAEQVSGN